MSATTGAPTAATPRTTRPASPTTAGALTLTRFFVRRDRVRIPVWALSVSVMFLYATVALGAVYPTASDRQVRANLVSSPAAIMMTGPGYGTDDYTLGAMVANEFTLWVVAAVAIMNVLLVVRHTRAEEETGRAELVRAGVVGRRAPGLAAFCTAVVANLAVGVLSLVMLLVGGASVEDSGITVPDTVALCLGVALTGLVFAAVASVTSQVTEHARAASGAAFAVLGLAYLLRAIGDVQAEHGSWVSWLSPLAWTQQTRPYVDLRWWPLALPVVLVVVLLLVAVRLTARRDLGAGLVPVRPGRADARPGLRSPFALAWRQQRASVVAWGSGIAVLGLATGTFANQMDDITAMVEDNALAAEIFGGPDQVLDAFDAVMVLFLAVGVGAWALASFLRAHGEETSGRAEPLLVAPVSRSRWLGAHLAVTGIGTLVLLAGAGLSLGLGEVAVGREVGALGEILVATLLYLPAVAVLVGVSALAFGVLGRLVQLGWALLAYAFVVGMFGPLLDLPSWAVHVSPFASVPTLADADAAWWPLAVLVVVAVALLAGSFVGFRRRDLATG
ncbi:ABC-2 type transport system permease protein [Sediminihabitans luteus]|uniref:ABC-2 type transport system permease protein n=1 Tax=Sediminihabitans luteus TaxID=1138585 RepID=A0A2M9CER6_9CELL|nr:hypothetical protein [Sediminihabitans luteus]PJJ70345.1 ABC-2 type transport system permease protein [Sediminihabitans luteus]GII97817.1 exporter of polyketide antibiotics [Sediminihabitans luteus]